MKNVECEERAMISKEQYDAILNDFLSLKIAFNHINQTNTYYDDDELSLKKSHKVLRYRKTDTFDELTLKIKGENGDVEINESLDVHPEIDKVLEKPFSSYHIITSLFTERYEFIFDNYLVVVDRNEYNNITDFNIEVEAINMDLAKEIIVQLCNKYSIEYKKDYLSKSRRAFLSANIKI